MRIFQVQTNIYRFNLGITYIVTLTAKILKLFLRDFNGRFR
jgi:hypothetical protein